MMMRQIVMPSDGCLHSAGPIPMPDLADRRPAQADREGVAAGLTGSGARVEVKGDVGGPCSNVARAAHDADLVIVSINGRGGIDRLRHGSVAGPVLHVVDLPALPVRAGARASVGA
jgi:nucleotide-binding universal stress UspA family protein